MKFNMGETVYWVESSSYYGKKVPCPMCFGKRLVTIILGDDSQTKIDCGFCGHGREGPTGTATVWEPDARVDSGLVSGFSTNNGPRYEVGRKTIEEELLFSTLESAELEREKRYALELERSKELFKTSFVDCKKSQIWSAGYHKESIAHSERNIRWHQMRLGMIEEKGEKKNERRTCK